MTPLPLLDMAPPRIAPRPGAYQDYRAQQVLGASPMQLILMLYEIAIVSCERRDAERACKALTELISALNFDYEDISVGLFRLYEYCHWEVRRGQFAPAAGILRRLKESWEEALAQRAAA